MDKRKIKMIESLRKVEEELEYGEIEVDTSEGIAYITETVYDAHFGIGLFIHMTDASYEEWLFCENEAVDRKGWHKELLKKLENIKETVAKETAEMLGWDDYHWKDSDYGIVVFPYPPIHTLDVDDDDNDD